MLLDAVAANAGQAIDGNIAFFKCCAIEQAGQLTVFTRSDDSLKIVG